MELKKYFHEKLFINFLTILIGLVLVSLVISFQTIEINVIATYGFLFIIFSVLHQLLKSTVKRFKRARYKITKDWIFIIADTLLVLIFAIVAYYTNILLYRVVAIFLVLVGSAADYCLYRFVYIQKLFKLPQFRNEMLFFSWNMWGKMLNNGTDKEVVANLIVDAQTKSNDRFSGNSWGSGFSGQQIITNTSGENNNSNTSLDIPIEVINGLKTQALFLVNNYLKTIKKK